MNSMTGYGQASLTKSGVVYEATARSVNGRFLELRFHMPKEFQAWENRFRQKFAKYFSRGHVDISLRVHLQRERGWKVEPRLNLMNEYLKAFRGAEKLLKLKTTVPSDFLLRVPEFFDVVAEDSKSFVNEKLALQVMEAAGAQCRDERVREGKALQTEVHRLITDLELQTKALMGSAAEQTEHEQLRLKKLLESTPSANEVIMDRGDVTEELTRLSEHLKSLRNLLKSPGALGKRLDFYCQELLREINTIGSKSLRASLTQGVVEAKMIVEKLKEQVQNIE